MTTVVAHGAMGPAREVIRLQVDGGVGIGHRRRAGTS